MKTNTESKSDRLKTLIKLESSDNNKLIQGIWAENGEDNAIFLIKTDSMYYVEEMDKPIDYFIDKDTLIVNADPIIKWTIIKLNEDSLLMTNEYLNDTLRLYKRK